MTEPEFHPDVRIGTSTCASPTSPARPPSTATCWASTFDPQGKPVLKADAFDPTELLREQDGPG